MVMAYRAVQFPKQEFGNIMNIINSTSNIILITVKKVESLKTTAIVMVKYSD